MNFEPFRIPLNEYFWIYVYSKPIKKIQDEVFFSFQKLAQISSNYINFPTERIKAFVDIEMFKIENHCKTPEVVDATDGTRHTRKRGLRTLKRMLSLRILKKTFSLRHLKRTLLVSTLKRTLPLRILKEPYYSVP